MSKVVYMGAKGSFSHLAALKAFGPRQDFLNAGSFQDVLEKVCMGKSNFGVIPLENSLAGSIYENYDALCNYPVQIVGEIYMRVEHCILGKGMVEEMKSVYSHPKALEQCRRFFAGHPWLEPRICSDTASAALTVAQSNDSTLGAIANATAADIYGLEILAANIEDDCQNYTRFAVISGEAKKEDPYNKCSLMFALKHAPGSLLKMLEIFARYGVNLTKIQSRPWVGRPFEYLFYSDFTHPEMASIIDPMLKKIAEEAELIKFLGLYREGIWP